MTDFVRAQISSWLSTDPSLDKVTNTLYFRASTTDPFLDTDWEDLATDLLAAYNLGGGTYARGADRQQVKLYDMEDAEPRQPKWTANSSVATGAAGVREVALCLSFRGESNTPRQKGRIYLGPFAQDQLVDRPLEGTRNVIKALAVRLGDLGGANVDWCVFSPTQFSVQPILSGAFAPVRLAWIDDAWDTQRSRGLAPQVRSLQAMDE